MLKKGISKGYLKQLDDEFAPTNIDPVPAPQLPQLEEPKFS